MHYFSIVFKKVNKQGVIFARLDEKHKLLGNLKKTLKIIDKKPIEKLNF